MFLCGHDLDSCTWADPSDRQVRHLRRVLAGQRSREPHLLVATRHQCQCWHLATVSLNELLIRPIAEFNGGRLMSCRAYLSDLLLNVAHDAVGLHHAHPNSPAPSGGDGAQGLTPWRLPE